jgi:hypothetical protein
MPPPEKASPITVSSNSEPVSAQFSCALASEMAGFIGGLTEPLPQPVNTRAAAPKAANLKRFTPTDPLRILPAELAQPRSIYLIFLENLKVQGGNTAPQNQEWLTAVCAATS